MKLSYLLALVSSAAGAPALQPHPDPIFQPDPTASAHDEDLFAFIPAHKLSKDPNYKHKHEMNLVASASGLSLGPSDRSEIRTPSLPIWSEVPSSEVILS